MQWGFWRKRQKLRSTRRIARYPISLLVLAFYALLSSPVRLSSTMVHTFYVFYAAETHSVYYSQTDIASVHQDVNIPKNKTPKMVELKRGTPLSKQLL